MATIRNRANTIQRVRRERLNKFHAEQQYIHANVNTLDRSAQIGQVSQHRETSP
ncbi:hypothetical protein [Kutzneria sp. 744]|uniref:hypothetical protein n=1 Tax=Kutzneria sp. (strain 744) TaxID=345341 RepID=UPI0004BA4156|nr:hypothetical protein [Kutzneria sp. 744]